MARDQNFVKQKIKVAANLTQAYAAFTHPATLSHWLSNGAQAEAHPGGRIYLWWENGYYASGEFTTLEPEKKIEFTWLGRDDPGKTLVQVELAEEEDLTSVILVHLGLGDSKKWAKTAKVFTKSWKRSLENLKSVLETGMDLRNTQRPITGLSLEEWTAERAASLEIKAKHGLFINDVVAGLGAQQAGLQKDDLLTKMAGHKLNSLVEFRLALQGKAPGDTVKITFHRGPDKFSNQIVLSARTISELPPSTEIVIGTMQDAYAKFQGQVSKSVLGIKDAPASHRVTPESWNIKEILAHLIATERDLHNWLSNQLEGQNTTASFYSHTPARIAAIITATPNPTTLFRALKTLQSETLAILAEAQPVLNENKSLFGRVSTLILALHGHLDDHSTQIDACLAGYIATQSALPQQTKE
jgi:uncharacterized protein YndB with AHSA1/START domain